MWQIDPGALRLGPIPRALGETILLTAVTLLVVTLLLVPIGVGEGFREAKGYLLFFLLHGVVLTHAIVWATYRFRATRTTDAVITTVILAFAQIVVVTESLSLFRALRLFPILLSHLFILVGHLLWWGWEARRGGPFLGGGIFTTQERRLPMHPLPIFLGVGVGVTLALVAATGLTRIPVAYDSLTYHLVFPVHWLQKGTLSIYPTPFGDQAPAYAPSNGEILYLFWILPFRGDLLVRIGQLPFALLAAISLFGIALRLGWKSRNAIFVPFFFLLARPVLLQTIDAYVDLIFSATYLAALYLLLRYADDGSSRSLGLGAAALGLSIGSKYAALVFAPTVILPFLLLIARKTRDRRAMFREGFRFFGIVLLCGGYFYLRNAILTGSPIYPAALSILGVTIFPGAYTREVMQNSPFHLQLNDLGLVLGSAFGWKLFLLVLPAGALTGALKIYWRHERRIRGLLREDYLLLLPFLLLALYWWGIPYNSEYRFLLPAVALTALWFGYILENVGEETSRGGWRLSLLRGIYGGAVLWLILGMTPEFHLAGTPVRIGSHGLIEPAHLRLWGILVGVSLLLVLSLRRWIRSPGVHRAGVILLFFGLIVVSVSYHARIAPGKPCSFFRPPRVHFPAQFFAGWQWIATHAKDARIAYTGNNIPYHLFGSRYRNEVFYVNIDRHADWRFHDYERAHRRRSGHVMPKTPKPAYDRAEKDERAWIANLLRRGTDFLFVTAMTEYETRYLWHDETGFPVEDHWARRHPKRFRLVYENRLVRIYRIEGERGRRRPGNGEAGGSGKRLDAP
ncbi:MAG: hypothetical protein D6795_15945 [Deltaproteobacteria bacterium]|nr:MAG: hypothetical protein D6795_15945 [Deltaproteobacteria bacterium]